MIWNMLKRDRKRWNGWDDFNYYSRWKLLLMADNSRQVVMEEQDKWWGGEGMLMMDRQMDGRSAFLKLCTGDGQCACEAESLLILMLCVSLSIPSFYTDSRQFPWNGTLKLISASISQCPFPRSLHRCSFVCFPVLCYIGVQRVIRFWGREQSLKGVQITWIESVRK